MIASNLRDLQPYTWNHAPRRRRVRTLSYVAVSAAFVALPVRATLAQAPSTGKPPVAAVAPAASALSAFTRSLPGGVTVTLLQVSTPGAGRTSPGKKPQTIYWKPDGTRSATSLTDDPRIVGNLAKIPDMALLGEHDDTFTFLFTGLSEGQKPSVTQSNGKEFDESSYVTFNGKGLTSCSCEEPKDKREESFRIGLPGAKWTTERRIPLAEIRKGNHQLDTDMKSLANGRLGAQFIGVYATDFRSAGTITILFGMSSSNESASVQQRASLLDGKGNPLASQMTVSGNGRNYVIKMLDYGKEAPKSAAFVLVETRTNAWVTIDRVALKPKGSLQ